MGSFDTLAQIPVKNPENIEDLVDICDLSSIMEQEGGGLQPWQVFTAMFVGFWAISAYFDHFLLTGVFCIAFGVLGEIMTKMIYGENIGKNLEIQKEELKRLLEIVEKEKTQPEEDELFEIQQNIVHQ